MIEYQDLIGIPYKKNGRDKSGMDCLGIVAFIHKREGIPFSDKISPDEDEIIHQLVTTNEDMAIKLDRPEIGCIVTFCIRPPYVTHLGMVIENNKFIHIFRNGTAVIERLDSPFWSRRIRGFYKWKIESV